jgi:hypothetical protein
VYHHLVVCRRYKTSCKYETFRRFAFDLGRRHLESGTLGQITIKAIIAAYQEARPLHKLPRTINACLQWEPFQKAVVADDIDLLPLRRIQAPTRDVKTMQEKLRLRPDLGPVVDWCMAWIRETRRAGVIPTQNAMLLAWEDERAKHPTNPFFKGLFTPKYAGDQCAIHWNVFMDYEKTLNAAQGEHAVGFGTTCSQESPSPALAVHRQPLPTYLC